MTLNARRRCSTPISAGLSANDGADRQPMHSTPNYWHSENGCRKAAQRPGLSIVWVGTMLPRDYASLQDGIAGCLLLLPGRKVIEHQQTVLVLLELLQGLWILCLVLCKESLERYQGIGTGRSYENVLHGRFHPGLLRRRQIVQHTIHLVESATLVKCGEKLRFQRCPETHGTISISQQRTCLQPAYLYVKQHLLP